MFTNTFVAVILASSLACVVTTIGIYVIGRFEDWGRRNTVYFMSFAAGVLVSVSFIHIIPRSFQMHSSASEKQRGDMKNLTGLTPGPGTRVGVAG